MGNNNEKSISPQERDLFHKVAQDIKDRPTRYREAGKWLDEYCGEEAYWERQEKRLNELRRKEREFPSWPIPKQVRQLEQEIEQRRTPALAVRFQKARDYLFEKYKQEEFIPEDDAKRIILITWLYTDADAEKAGLGITELEKWFWEPIDDPLKMSRAFAQFLWRNGGRAYDTWMQLVGICQSKLAQRSYEEPGLAVEHHKHRLARNFLDNLLRASIKHLPVVGSFLYDVIYGTLDSQASHEHPIRLVQKPAGTKFTQERDTQPHRATGKEKWYQNRTIQAALISAGVLLLVSIGGWLIMLYANRPHTDTPEAKLLLREDKRQLSLREVCQDIDTRPLLQREETAKRYVGMRIKREPLSLYYISEEDESFQMLMVFPGDLYVPFRGGWGVSFSIKRNDYPELTGAKQGLIAYVSGIIEDAGEHYVQLSDVSLGFD